MKNSNGQLALVTGGSSGIGFAIAKRLSEDGAKVVISGRRRGALEKAAKDIGNGAVGIVADVTDQASMKKLYEQINRQYGKVDVVVANAGGGEHAPLGQITEEQIDKQFSTNVKGVVFTLQEALNVLSETSSIVIVGSSASIDPGPTMSIYGGTKAAIRNMMRSWLVELKGKGIRINVVSPGPTNTESLREAFGENAEAGLAYLTDKSPIGRIGEPSEIASVVSFLASDSASYVNGVELFVDGGASQI